MLTIGKGCSSDVYLDNNRAIKVFHKQENYKRELKWLKCLSSNSFCIRMFDYNDEKSTIEMEYIPNTLESIKPLLDYKRKIDILHQVASFIAEVPNCCHKDLKSKNILVTEDDKIKIIDFESARRTKNKTDDIKKFKFLMVELVFEVSYQESYKKYKKYKEAISPELREVLDKETIKDIKDYLALLINIS